MVIKVLVPTRKFERDLKALSPQLRLAVKSALDDLLKDPVPAHRRLHPLGGYKPTVYTIDVLSNHSYKLSFEISGATAILRRIAPHIEIDRWP